jgi:EmrB/QacA subfamily drug resistance transporter
MARNVRETQSDLQKAAAADYYNAPLDMDKRTRRVVLIGTLLALLLSATDQTVVSTALPRIVGHLGGLNLFSWVFTAFMLTSTTTVPLAGKLSDLYGRKPFFLGGILILLAGSVAAGTSQTMTQLIIYRAIQGLGAGFIMGNAFAVIGDLFPPAERGKYQGLFTGVFGVASILGPTLGGFLTDQLTWRAVFYINLPVGLMALTILWRTYPSHTRSGIKRSIDYTGAALLSATIVPLLLALVWGGKEFAWTSPEIIGLFVLSFVGAGTLIWNESRAAEPIIPLSLFENRVFAVGVLLSFVTGMGLFGVVNYMPTFVQGVLGATATNSGLVTSPFMLGMVTASIISGQLVSRTGRYRPLIIIGTILITLGVFLLSTLDAGSIWAAAIAAMMVTGFGVGLSMPIVNLAVQNSVPHRQLGVVSSSTQFFRQIGGTLGTAIFGTLLTSHVHANLAHELSPNLIAQTPPNLIETLEEPRTLLSPEALDRLRSGFESLGPQGIDLYNQAFEAMRVSLADAIGLVFFIAMCVTGASILVAFLMPDSKQALRSSWADPEPGSAQPPAEPGEAVLEGEPIS